MNGYEGISADRTNSSVSQLSEAFSPAVLRPIQTISQAALELEDAQSIKAFLKDQDFNHQSC